MQAFEPRLSTADNVKIMAHTAFLVTLILYTWWQVLPVILRQLGATTLDVSVAYALFAFGQAVLQWWGGKLGDIVGRKPMIVWPTLFLGVLYALAAPLLSWQWVVLFLVLNNMALAIQGPSYQILIAESVHPRRRSGAFASFQLWSGIATALGPAVGALLFPAVGARGLMLMTALAAFAATAVRQRSLKETRGPDRGLPMRFREAFSGELGLMHLVAIFFSLVTVMTLNGPFVALFLSSAKGFPPSIINLMFAVGPLPAVLISLRLGSITTALGARRVLMWSLAGHLAMLALWGVLSGPVWVALAFVFVYLFYQALFIAFFTLRAEVAQRHNGPAVMGAMGMTSGIAGALGLPLAGDLSGHFGPAMPFILAFVFGIPCLLFARRLVDEEETAPVGQLFIRWRRMWSRA